MCAGCIWRCRLCMYCLHDGLTSRSLQERPFKRPSQRNRAYDNQDDMVVEAQAQSVAHSTLP
jgi:hypothetical protein